MPSANPSTQGGVSMTAQLRSRFMTCAYIGDSLTQGSVNTYSYADAFPTLVSYYSQGKIIPAGFWGVGGQRADQIYARVQQALINRPTYLAVLAGTNDIGQMISQGYTILQVVTRVKGWLKAIYKSAEAVGTIPVAICHPPNNSSSFNRQIVIQAVNLWIRREAMKRGYPLVDFYSTMVNDGVLKTPAGQYQASPSQLTLDGTHPTPIGTGIMAQLFATSLTAAAPAAQMPLQCVDTTDPSQLLFLGKNPLFAAQTGHAGVFPDNWGVSGAPLTDPNTTYAMVQDANLPGYGVQISRTTSATQQGGLASNNFNVAAGDLIAVGGYYSTDGITSTVVQLSIDALSTRPVNITTGGQPAGAAVTRGYYYMEYVAQGAGSPTVSLLGGNAGGKASQQTFWYPAIVNLTRSIGEKVPITPN